MRMISNSIVSDFRKNWLFLSILFIGFIPEIWGGYSMYILIFLFPFIIRKRIPRQTKSAVLIIAFSICYTIPLLFQRNCPSFSVLIFCLIFPIISYWSGIYICRNTLNSNTPLVVIVLLTACIAIWSITVNLLDFIQTGNVVNIMRSLESEGSGDAQKATIHNMMLSMAIGGIGIIFIKPNNKFDKTIKPIILIISILALFGGIHLLNRTAIVLAACSLFIGLYWAGISIKRLCYILFLILTVLIIYTTYFDGSTFLEAIEAGFSSREKYSSRTSMVNAGGRTDRWIAGLNQIFIMPFGSEGLLYYTDSSFAHNAWVDIGIRGGIISFILIIIMTYIFLSLLRRLLKFYPISKFIKGYLLMIIACMFLQWAVEPVVEGVFPLFLIFFFIYGFMVAYPYITKHPSKIFNL